MWARYVFAVTFRLEPGTGVSVEPSTFETRLFHEAAEPGEDGWRFFRDNLWRGEIADEDHFRSLVEAALGVTVLSVDYRAFETDEAYLSALRDAIAADLPSFRDESVDAVLNKYLGSSVEVRQ
ncbi:MAG: LWR-salt protein [Halanaeroarchaeum sp.]